MMSFLGEIQSPAQRRSLLEVLLSQSAVALTRALAGQVRLLGGAWINHKSILSYAILFKQLSEKILRHWILVR